MIRVKMIGFCQITNTSSLTNEKKIVRQISDPQILVAWILLNRRLSADRRSRPNRSDVLRRALTGAVRGTWRDVSGARWWFAPTPRGPRAPSNCGE